MEVKICIKCGIEKSLSEFTFRSDTQNYHNVCKECKNEYARQYHKKNIEIIKEKSKKFREENSEKIKKAKKLYYEKNKEKISEKGKVDYRKNADYIKERQQKYNEKNKEKILNRQKDYYEQNKDERIKKQREYYQENKEQKKNYDKTYREKNKGKLQEYMRKWNQENKETIYQKRKVYNEENAEMLRTWRRENKKKRKANDPIYKFSEQIRTLINNSFRKKGYTKGTKTYKILGCDFEIFYKYLLETYKRNYGIEWDGIEKVHIDHIIPLATVNTEEEITKLCHYTNLQLLKAKDNLEKQANLDWNL